MNNLIFCSATEIARRIRDREISTVEVVEAHLARMDEVNPALNAVVTRCDGRALKKAKDADAALDEDRAVGPLHGVPVTIKDAFDTAGVRSAGGTQGRADFVPAVNATVVERLLAAGAILIGKTNTPELTFSYDTDNLLFGQTFNPYDSSLSPGGSSGGSAAIVAAGGSPLDIGSDTGGSIRIPAHFCGVAGIKPTAGRVPRTGLIVPGGVPVDSLMQVGPIARFVEDLELVLPIISGVDWKDCSAIPADLEDPELVDMEEIRAAYYTDNGEVAASAEVAAALESCVRVIAEQGAKVTGIRPPGIERSRDLFERVFATDGGAWIRRLVEKLGTRDLYPHLKWIEAGEGEPESSARDFTAMLEELDQFRRDMLGFFQHFDVILAPVHANAAQPHCDLTGEERGAGFGFSQTYNLTGWPSVVVRAGASEKGLPIGVQVVAWPWREDVALAVARKIEDALGGWQPPPVISR